MIPEGVGPHVHWESIVAFILLVIALYTIISALGD
jgi:hypothetical protein